MKRACFTNTNPGANLICEFHPTYKNELFTNERSLNRKLQKTFTIGERAYSNQSQIALIKF
jgi:hypothetical protein